MARRLDYEKESKLRIVRQRGEQQIDYSDRTLPPSGYPRLGNDFSIERRQSPKVTARPALVQETLEEAVKAAIRAVEQKRQAKRQLKAKRAAADAKKAAAQKAAAANRKKAAPAGRRAKKRPGAANSAQAGSKGLKSAAARKPTATVRPATVVQSGPGGKQHTVQVEFKTAPKSRATRRKP